MAKVGSVIIDVAADTAKLVEGMNKAQQKVDNTVRSIKKNLGVMTGALATVGISASFGSMITDSINAADATGELAEKLALSTEALSRYQYVAKFAGVEVGTLDAAMSAMIRRTNNFTRDGGGAAANAMKILGISTADARREFTSTEATFDYIIKKIQEMPDGYQKTAVAQDIFSKSASSVVRYANLGASEIERLGIQAEKTGNIISEEFAGNAGALNDGLDVLSGSFTGIANQLVQEFTPSMLKAARAAEKLLGVQRDLSDFEIIEKIKKTKEKIKAFEDDLNTISLGDKIFGNSEDGKTRAELRASQNKLLFLTQELELRKKLRKEAAAEAAKKAAEAAKKYKDRHFGSFGVGSSKSSKDLTTKVDIGPSIDFSKPYLEYEEKAREYEEKVKAANLRVYDDYLKLTMDQFQYKKYTLAMQYNEDLKYTTDVETLNKNLALQLQGVDKEREKHLEDLKNKGEDVAKAIGASFESALGDNLNALIMKGKFSFSDFANSIISDLVRIAVQQQIIAPLSQGMSGMFNGLFNAHGNAFVNGKVQAYATGGVVSSPTFFSHGGGLGVMGEAGTEAIMPLTRVGADLGVKSTPSRVTLNIVNNSGTDVKAEQISETTKTNKNGEQERVLTMVIDGVLRNKLNSRDLFKGLTR